VPQLSVVLENGPEAESPRQSRNMKIPPPPSIPAPKLSDIPLKSESQINPAAGERKFRRISRFLRPDFYEISKEEKMARDSAAAAVTAAAAALLKQQDPNQQPYPHDPPQLERYQPDEALVALGKRNADAAKPAGNPVTVTVRSLHQLRQTPPAFPTPSPPPSLPAPIPAAQVIPKDASISPEKSIKSNRSSSGDSGSSKNQKNASAPGSKSPKLTVRRQFEHLINLAAAQFQRGASPGKAAAAAAAAAPTASTSRNNSSSSNQEAISMELKQLEDEIKNAAVAKAEAAAKLELLKNEHAARSLAGSASIRPAIPLKPEFLTCAPAAIVNGGAQSSVEAVPDPSSLSVRENPYTFQSFRRRSALSPPPPGPESNVNGSRLAAMGSPLSNGVKASPFDEESVRYARVKRLEALDHAEMGDGELTIPPTPTDSYESSSVCSDLLRDHDNRESGDDESVSERIFRKSFYTRFNESSKKRQQQQHPQQQQQQQHRRSITSKDLDSGNAGQVTSPVKSTSDSATNLPPRLPARSRHASREESAEAVMVRKFISSRSDSVYDSLNSERERRMSSIQRRQQQQQQQQQQQHGSDHDDDNLPNSGSVSHRSSMSRENSVVRSMGRSSEVTSPTPSNMSDPMSPGRDRDRSYSRSYSTRVLPSMDAHPSSASQTDGYSSSSLGRRSFFSSNSDHISSLPRRTNRYSVQEPDLSHSKHSTHSAYGMAPMRSAATRSSYVHAPPSSRYTSIYEESGRDRDSRRDNLLSPTSSRRSTALLSDSTRRESTFYGLPSSRDSSLGRRSDVTGATPSSSYYSRGSSSGLDHSTSANTGSYATMRPSFLRYRR